MTINVLTAGNSREDQAWRERDLRERCMRVAMASKHGLDDIEASIKFADSLLPWALGCTDAYALERSFELVLNPKMPPLMAEHLRFVLRALYGFLCVVTEPVATDTPVSIEGEEAAQEPPGDPEREAIREIEPLMPLEALMGEPDASASEPMTARKRAGKAPPIER